MHFLLSVFLQTKHLFLQKVEKIYIEIKHRSSTHQKNFIRICIYVDIVVISSKFVYEADLKFRATIGF